MCRSLFLALRYIVKIMFPISLVSFFFPFTILFIVAKLYICNKVKSIYYTLNSNLGCPRILADLVYFYVCEILPYPIS